MPRQAASADVAAGIDAKIQGVIAEIDAQIGKLEQKKSALLGLFGASAPAGKRRGRPKGSTNKKGGKAVKAEKPAKNGRKKRVFSAETRKRLREAAKARWAKRRAEAGAA